MNDKCETQHCIRHNPADSQLESVAGCLCFVLSAWSRVVKSLGDVMPVIKRLLHCTLMSVES